MICCIPLVLKEEANASLDVGMIFISIPHCLIPWVLSASWLWFWDNLDTYLTHIEQYRQDFGSFSLKGQGIGDVRILVLFSYLKVANVH